MNTTNNRTAVELAPVLPAAGVTIRRGSFRWVHKGKRGERVECLFITPIHLCEDAPAPSRPRRPGVKFVSCIRCGLRTDESSGLCSYCQKEVPMNPVP